MAKSKVIRKFIRINGKRVSACFSTREDADRWVDEKKRANRLSKAGIFDVLSPATVEAFAAKWLLARQADGKPKSSWDLDEARLRLYVIPSFGNRRLHEVDTPEWEDFLTGLMVDEELKPATRNRIRALLSKMYNDARRARAVLRNPIELIPQLSEADDAWDYWHSLEEIRAYLQVSLSKSPSFFLFAHLSLNAGPRVGEIVALKPGDILNNPWRININKIYEQASGKTHVRTKGGRRRWLGVNEEMIKVLKVFEDMTKLRPKNWPLICHENGLHMDQHAIRKIHEDVCKRAGVKAIRVHDLRHTYASHFIMNGGTLAELQGLLGHSSPQMTQRYSHLAPGFLESKASRVAFSGLDEGGNSNLLILPKAD